jgi:hypothetical protein
MTFQFQRAIQDDALVAGVAAPFILDVLETAQTEQVQISWFKQTQEEQRYGR